MEEEKKLVPQNAGPAILLRRFPDVQNEIFDLLGDFDLDPGDSGIVRRIGIRLEARGVQFSDHLRDRKAGKYMLAAGAWTADWPDGQNFLALLYGPNAPDLNGTRFRLPEYDRLYEQALQLPDSPERDRLCTAR